MRSIDTPIIARIPVAARNHWKTRGIRPFEDSLSIIDMILVLGKSPLNNMKCPPIRIFYEYPRTTCGVDDIDVFFICCVIIPQDDESWDGFFGGIFWWRRCLSCARWSGGRRTWGVYITCSEENEEEKTDTKTFFHITKLRKYVYLYNILI